MILRNSVLLVPVLALLASACKSTSADLSGHDQLAPVPAAPAGASFSDPYINDGLFRETMSKELAKLAAANPELGKTLGRQARERRHCQLELPEVPATEISPDQLYDRLSESVLVVGMYGRCPNCPRTHYIGGATAFVISADGLAVTNFHVVNLGDNVQAMGCLTRDGRFLAVKEVLAADPDADVAIIRLDGAGLKPLPIRSATPPGTEVAVVSHPESRHYTMTRGVVSRRCVVARGQPPEAPVLPRKPAAAPEVAKAGVPAEAKPAAPEAPKAAVPAGKAPAVADVAKRPPSKLIETLVIDADYAKGSSGAPVCDLQGRVVGVVSSTNGIYYNEDPKAPHAGDLQMVVKMCVPAEKILKLGEGAKR